MKGSSLDREAMHRPGPMRCCAWDVAGLAQHGVSEALKAEVSKAISGKPRGLQAADWPIVAAIAATFLIVATLPQNSTALADQVVAGHLRSLASYSWDSVLKPHPRAPDQPKTKIDVVYAKPQGGLEHSAQAARSIRLLETVAEHVADEFAWPAPFTLEMQSCGFPNARWDLSARKLTLCYELAADFEELYRAYGVARAESPKRKFK